MMPITSKSEVTEAKYELDGKELIIMYNSLPIIILLCMNSPVLGGTYSW